MMRRTFILFLAVIIACPAVAAKRRAVRGPSINARHILWIAAHPDDEIVPAPLLAQLCIDEGASCTFLVVTRGENGICALPGGCGDLGALRSAEMQRSAAALNAVLIQWSLPDAMNDVRSRWESDSGGRPALVERIRTVIRGSAPDLILTFDPKHGTSCHPAHREIASLALEAAEGLAPFLLLETVTRHDGDRFVFRNALPGRAWTFEAGWDWDALVRIAELHASQFTAADLDDLRAMPVAERRVWMIPATIAPTDGYDIACE